MTLSERAIVGCLLAVVDSCLDTLVDGERIHRNTMPELDGIRRAVRMLEEEATKLEDSLPPVKATVTFDLHCSETRSGRTERYSVDGETEAEVREEAMRIAAQMLMSPSDIDLVSWSNGLTVEGLA